MNIIKANKTLTEKMQQDANAKVIDDWTTVLQYYCATMIDNHIPGLCACCAKNGACFEIHEGAVGW